MHTVPYQLCPKCGGNKVIGSITSNIIHPLTCDICDGEGIIPEHVVKEQSDENKNEVENIKTTRQQQLKVAIIKRFGRIYQSHLDIINTVLEKSEQWSINDMYDLIELPDVKCKFSEKQRDDAIAKIIRKNFDHE